MDILSMLPATDVVFPQIFDFLSIKEIFKLRLVSTSYCHLVKEYFEQCSKIDLSNECKWKITPDVFKLMTEKNEVLQELIVPDSNHWLHDDLFAPVVCVCVNLSKVDLTNCTQLTNRSLCMLGSYCHMLQKISLRGCHWVDKDNLCLLVSNNPNLIELDVSSCWNLDDEAIIFTAKSCQHLKSISLSNVYSINDCSLEHLAKYCSKLQKINIRGCWRVTNGGIKIIGEHCQQLQQLDIAECQKVTEESLARLRFRKIMIDVVPQFGTDNRREIEVHGFRLNVAV